MYPNFFPEQWVGKIDRAAFSVNTRENLLVHPNFLVLERLGSDANIYNCAICEFLRGGGASGT